MGFKIPFNPTGIAVDKALDAAKNAAQSASVSTTLGVIIYTGFETAELNPGQEVVAFYYCAPAMMSVAFEAMESYDASIIGDAGLDAHYAAEEILSDTIQEIVDSCQEVLDGAAEDAEQAEQDAEDSAEAGPGQDGEMAAEVQAEGGIGGD